jgi:3-phosphoshikimate 1-carboxyvinyltransferase
MKKFIVDKSKIQGEIAIPPSKSHTLRAILFGSMAKGKTVIHHYLPSPDTYAMVEACRILGAKIEVLEDPMIIQGLDGKINHAEDVINAGNSGIVLRFCAAVGALAKHPVVITGDQSIRYQRPMKPLLEGLSRLGVSAKSMRGDFLAPVIIQGPLKSGKTIISGEDSQPVSALIIASAFAEGPIEIEVQNPGEKPWVGMTLSWLDKLKIPYKNNCYNQYSLQGNAQYDGFEYTVPGDFSSAAFPIAAALVTQSELTVKNLDMNDSQGDKELISAFVRMGAHINIDEKNKTLHVKKGNKLSGIVVDINDYIDAITILAVVACFAEGETVIKNASIAKVKECNRIQCITNELKKMGAEINETADGLIIQKSSLKGYGDLQSHNDHRMAMSLAVAAMGARGPSSIQSIDCVNKTFPTFLSDFKKLGAVIEEL